MKRIIQKIKKVKLRKTKSSKKPVRKHFNSHGSE